MQSPDGDLCEVETGLCVWAIFYDQWSSHF